jgi:hypothetical protein
VTKNLSLSRLGISGTYTAKNLWDGTFTPVTGTNLNVQLGARQAKLFRLMSTAPTSTNINARLNGGQLTLNWPADHIGWRLQTSLTAGSWSDITGSRETNTWIVSLSQASPGAFFRLAWP